MESVLAWPRAVALEKEEASIVERVQVFHEVIDIVRCIVKLRAVRIGVEKLTNIPSGEIVWSKTSP